MRIISKLQLYRFYLVLIDRNEKMLIAVLLIVALVEGNKTQQIEINIYISLALSFFCGVKNNIMR